MKQKMSIGDQFRMVARWLGIGRILLKLTPKKQLSSQQLLELVDAKRTYLAQISNAKPIPADSGNIEVHLLLHKERIYEGIWAFYSFTYFAAQPCRLIVHDDGSLTESDEKIIGKIFPGFQLISRIVADDKVIGYFESRGLKLCARFRKNYVLGLKLFDPKFFAVNDHFILLDSDVLFFSYPQELIEGLGAKNDTSFVRLRYSLDKGNAYSHSLSKLNEPPPV